MLNHIWAAMIAIGIIYGALTGNMEAVANGALDAAGEAVQLCITMIGVMGLWVGLMEIASKSGLIASMTRESSPLSPFFSPVSPRSIPPGSTYPQISSPISSVSAGPALPPA